MLSRNYGNPFFFKINSNIFTMGINHREVFFKSFHFKMGAIRADQALGKFSKQFVGPLRGVNDGAAEEVRMRIELGQEQDGRERFQGRGLGEVSQSDGPEDIGEHVTRQVAGQMEDSQCARCPNVGRHGPGAGELPWPGRVRASGYRPGRGQLVSVVRDSAGLAGVGRGECDKRGIVEPFGRGRADRVRQPDGFESRYGQ